MEIILTVIYFFLFSFIIFRWKFFDLPGITRQWLLAAFTAKMLSGVFLGIIYTYYYTDRLTADTFKFFDDSRIMYNMFWINKKHFFKMLTGYHDNAAYLLPYYDLMHNWYNKIALFNDYRTQIRINTLLRFISGGHYYVHSVMFSFFSFLGLTAMLKLFLKELPDKKTGLFFGIYFMPSVLFWGSGLLKDGLILFATGFALWFLHQTVTGKKRIILHAVLFLFFLLFLIAIKFHNYILLFPLLIAYGITMLNPQKIFLKFTIITAAYFIALINIDLILPGYGLTELIAKKQFEFLELNKMYNPGSEIPLSTLYPSIKSLLLNAPEAYYHSFLRPWFFESKSPFILLAGFENLIIIFLFISAAMGFRKANMRYSPLFYVALFYVLLLFLLIGLVVPVMGSIVRYKTQALPFLIFLLVMATDRKLLLIRFPFLEKIIPKGK